MGFVYIESGNMAESEFPRSLKYEETVYVVFNNSSEREVHLFWINYAGMLTSYGILSPRKRKRMNTYETHPWVARDVQSGLPLLLNGDIVYYPLLRRDGIDEDGDPDAPDNTVAIHIPGIK